MESGAGKEIPRRKQECRNEGRPEGHEAAGYMTHLLLDSCIPLFLPSCSVWLAPYILWTSCSERYLPAGQVPFYGAGASNA
jgi:hypothetical protein